MLLPAMNYWLNIILIATRSIKILTPPMSGRAFKLCKCWLKKRLIFTALCMENAQVSTKISESCRGTHMNSSSIMNGGALSHVRLSFISGVSHLSCVVICRCRPDIFFRAGPLYNVMPFDISGRWWPLAIIIGDVMKGNGLNRCG